MTADRRGTPQGPPAPPLQSPPAISQPRARPFAAAVLGLVLGLGCGLGWDQVDYCPDTGCTTCKGDADCVAGSSCCGKTLFCSHRKDAPTVCALGCEEPTPPPCRCKAGRCRFE